MPRIYARRVTEYDSAALRDAIEAALSRFDLSGIRGARVLLKPNLLTRKKPEDGVTTHPAVVRAVAAALRERGASLFLGDSPGGRNTEQSFQALLRVTGLGAVCEEFGIEPVLLDGETEMVALGHEAKIRLEVSAYAKRFDAIVNLPRFKTHSFMGLTGAVKNLFGFVPGLVKAQCHLRFTRREDFAAMLVDLAEYVKPALTVLDAVVAMDREGPSHGRLVRTGFIAVSDDVFALDAWLATLIGSDTEILTVREAASRGHGTDYELEGDTIELGTFEMPRVSDAASRLRTFGFARRHLTALPVFDRNLCTKCGECVNNCPPGALVFDSDGYPSLPDESVCIRCYCCNELCRYGAAQLRYPVLLRLIDRSTRKTGA